MRVVGLLDGSLQADRADEADTLIQWEAVSAELLRLGHEVSALEFSLDLNTVLGLLEEARPDLVFNLVESVRGESRFCYLAAAALELLGAPFTGASSASLFLTTHKVLAKELLAAHGLDTPP
jgi:D-alanine-D-alanine ligase